MFFVYCRDFSSVAALDMVSNLKKGDGWCATQNLGHISALDSMMFLVHFLSSSACMCWAKWWEMCSLYVCVWSHEQLWACVPPSCHSSGSVIVPYLEQGKSPVPGKIEDKRFAWRCRIAVFVSQVCPTVWDVRSCSCLNLTYAFLAKGSILVNKVTPAS